MYCVFFNIYSDASGTYTYTEYIEGVVDRVENHPVRYGHGYKKYSSSATLLSRPGQHVRRAFVPLLRSLLDGNTNKTARRSLIIVGVRQYDGVALAPPQFQLNVRIRCKRRRHSRPR